MSETEQDRPAELIESIHPPWRATVAQCLHRWRTLSPPVRSQSYLVLQGANGARQTLNAASIAALAARVGG